MIRVKAFFRLTDPNNNHSIRGHIMKSSSKNLLALAVSSIAMGVSTASVADNYHGHGYGHGHPSSVTQLTANLVDTVSTATGRGAMKWTSIAKKGIVNIRAGVTIPVDSTYGIADSNTAVSTPVTMTITHGDAVYSCDLKIAELYFKAPVAPDTTYPEYANYELYVSQIDGVQDDKYFGGCSNFPATLSAADTVSVSINGSTLTGSLK